MIREPVIGLAHLWGMPDRTGNDSAGALGGLLLTSLGLAAYRRSDTPEEKRRPFYIYIDEFQNFTTSSIAKLVAITT